MTALFALAFRVLRTDDSGYVLTVPMFIRGNKMDFNLKGVDLVYSETWFASGDVNFLASVAM